MREDEGREIAGFRIESEIGRGGMGVVYLAHQSFPDRKVALKLLSPDLASDPAFRERFVHESNAAASTEHPNIVPVFGAGEADGQLYLAMRYIEGTDLESLLSREGALPPERAARICAEIADALDAAHERGLIHRDVKPGNILLDARDRAYLTDFGLIRRTELHTGVTKTGQFMGQAARGPVCDRQGDGRGCPGRLRGTARTETPLHAHRARCRPRAPRDWDRDTRVPRRRDGRTSDRGREPC
ncbi:MAG: serine/threonine-protein kinase [Actinomycetota bacterium]